MDEEELPPLRTVTCHTEGCRNFDIPITFRCVMTVICGACGEQITDIVTA